MIVVTTTTTTTTIITVIINISPSPSLFLTLSTYTLIVCTPLFALFYRRNQYIVYCLAHLGNSLDRTSLVGSQTDHVRYIRKALIVSDTPPL